MIGFILKFLGGGVVDRVLDTLDRRVDSEEVRDEAKRDVIIAHMQTRGDWMRSGGFALMLLFAVPLAIWFSGVVIYSLLWCADCAYPQEWTIAALPAPLDGWSGAIIMSIFGVVGLDRFRR